jgi:arginine/lysine/ornithine decarboxylase
VHEYSWHTPGHTGGTAFLKSPAGREFFRFFGEALLRSDLSISVPELGSLLDHSGAIGAAERYAARVFGADRTYFVTNGTSTSNKVVFFATVGDGDMVLVDRNCHKSIEHAITMTRAQPVYLVPTRNRYGLIGPIPPARLRAGASGPAGTAMPAAAASPRPALAVVTNSTYDGLCYDAQRVADRLGESVDRILFDEAWFGHARFHPLYRGRFGMGVNGGAAGPTVFATQSTHKLLAALSQASLVHVRSGRAPVEHRRLNEAFMMHTSTSPLYTIIAANDVCSRMMDGPAGRVMIHDALQEAVAFRRAMVRLGAEIAAQGGPDWWFDPWQPRTVYDPARGAQVPFHEAGDDVLLKRPESWTLEPGAAWHGFAEQDEGYCLLDPTKVTLLTPGVAEDGSMAEVGIPAPVVSRFLDSRGIVPEKTGDYTILFLFSLGITKGKWGTLVTALLEFKRLFDQNAPLRDVLPSLVALAPAKYGAMGLRDLCREMHGVMRARRLPERLDAAFSALPARALTPAEAYGRLVRGTVDALPLAEAANRVSAVGIVPYPPGIPLLMPGETTGEAGGPALAYLAALEEFDRDFPGFEHEIHGIEAVDGRYRFYCVRAT